MARLVTKKQKEAIDKLVKELFMAVGLYISNNYIFDQDTNLPWKFKNKFMKYGTNIVHNNEELFDPLFIKPMVKDLFNIALAKNEEYSDIYIRSVCPIFSNQRKALIIYTDSGSLQTRFYEHEVLMYYEGCFILADTLNQDNIDLLSYIDSFMETIIPRKTTKRKKEIFDGIYRTTGRDY